MVALIFFSYLLSLYRGECSDCRDRGDPASGQHEELRPGQRRLQVHQEPGVCQAGRQDSLQVT